MNYGPTPDGALGIARSHNHAERESPGWTRCAVVALQAFARTVPDFTIEEARPWVTDRVGAPPDLRAWGAVTQMATRQGVICTTGAYRRATSSNGSNKPVYRAGAL